jgi:WD40 repeat protein
MLVSWTALGTLPIYYYHLDRALLWDIRKSQELSNTVAELHSDGPVTLLHLDPYKVVTGAPWDGQVHVWETRTGHLVNTLSCNNPVKSAGRSTLSAMAVDGCRIITTGSSTEGSLLHYQDFLRSSVPVASSGEEVSKFWGPQEYEDEDSDDDH